MSRRGYNAVSKYVEVSIHISMHAGIKNYLLGTGIYPSEYTANESCCCLVPHTLLLP